MNVALRTTTLLTNFSICKVYDTLHKNKGQSVGKLLLCFTLSIFPSCSAKYMTKQSQCNICDTLVNIYSKLTFFPGEYQNKSSKKICLQHSLRIACQMP